jgi:hypothetical protein
MALFIKFNRSAAYREYVRDWERRLMLAERVNEFDTADFSLHKPKPPRRIVK